MTRREFERWLLDTGLGRWPRKRKGLRTLGSGGYSTVYAHDAVPNKVLKITSGGADPWPQYVLWATRMGWAGLYAPKVYSMRVWPNGDYCAIVERLPFTLGDCVALQWRRNMDIRHAMEDGFRHDDWADLAKHGPEYLPFCKGLVDYRNSLPYGPRILWDITSSNILARADWTLVLNDPWYCDRDHPPIAWPNGKRFRFERSAAPLGATVLAD